MQTQEVKNTVAELTQRMDQMNQQLESLARGQQFISELFLEMTPILKEVMNAGSTQLQQLEDKGYFAFARETAGVVDQVVSGFSPEDVQLLGQNIVGILNTVKGLTQPDMLNLINDVAEPIHHPETVKPVGMYGMLKASRDDDVRRGFGVMVEVLRQVGRGVKGLNGNGSSSRAVVPAGNKADRMRSRLAPKRMADPVVMPAPAARQAAPVKPAPQAPKAAPPAPALEGFCAEGFLLDPESWTKEIAVDVATSLGVPELTEKHWQVIEFARADYMEVGKSPNIRRITLGMEDVTTKDLYTLFPKGPGKMIAKIAGIPKPGGCL